jgi:hypothetical protein
MDEEGVSNKSIAMMERKGLLASFLCVLRTFEQAVLDFSSTVT